MKTIAAIAAACLLAGCAVNATSPSGPAPGEITDAERAAAAKAAPLKPATPQTIAKIKTAARSALKDPDSAKWENVRQAVRPSVKGQPMAVACGAVNAKNAFGGFTGFKPFVFIIDLNQLHIAGGGDDVDDMLGEAIHGTFCGE